MAPILFGFGMVVMFWFWMPFKNRTILHSKAIQPLKIRMCLVFEPPLYIYSKEKDQWNVPPTYSPLWLHFALTKAFQSLYLCSFGALTLVLPNSQMLKLQGKIWEAKLEQHKLCTENTEILGLLSFHRVLRERDSMTGNKVTKWLHVCHGKVPKLVRGC